jgi:hypothetical protein
MNEEENRLNSLLEKTSRAYREAEANRQELLAACEAALRLLEPYYWTDLDGYAIQEDVDTLHAAIAKAKSL